VTQPRTVIHLCSTGGFYGAEHTIIELAAYARDHGWSSHVVALEGDGAPELVRRASAEGLTAAAFVSSGRLHLIPMLKRLMSYLKAHPGALVHSHGYKPDLLLSLPGIARTHIRVATCHSWYSVTRKLRALELADKRLLRSFHYVVAVSDEIRDELLASGVQGARLATISNGISAPNVASNARVKIKAELGIHVDTRLIIQVGRLASSKRNDILLTAFARSQLGRQCRLLFVGDGELRGTLQQLAKELGLADHVAFCGYRSDVADLVAAADLLVLSSDKEGLPIVLLEAMAIRCPIISTSVGAIPSTLRQGTDAWLVRANDVSGLSAALDEALSDPQEAHRRADNAYARYMDRFSRDSMGSNYLRIYDSLFNAHSPNSVLGPVSR